MSSEQFDRPFETDPSPALSRLSDLPEWKAPDMDNQYGPVQWHTGHEDSREQDPYPTTDFSVNTAFLREEDMW